MAAPGETDRVWVREVDAVEDATEWYTSDADASTVTVGDRDDVTDYAAEWTVPLDVESFASTVVEEEFGHEAAVAIETDERVYEGRSYGRVADRLDDLDLDVDRFEVASDGVTVRYRSGPEGEPGELSVRSVTGNVDLIADLHERTSDRELSPTDRELLELYDGKPTDVSMVEWFGEVSGATETGERSHDGREV